ncbi:MAG: ABC transporter substrate-binding protein, partial [bacterium]|nr:ABC transporter substrate-binding protein [bacterium]
MKKFFARCRAFFATVHLQYKKVRMLPYVLEKKERIVLLTLFLVALISGFFLFIRIAGWEFVRVPKSGGTYTEAIVGSPSLINPLFAVANPTDLDVTRLVYGGILRKDTEGNIIPDLAERFTVSPDQKTYTIRLRQNAYWHDGEKVTADDVLFTIERIQNPEMRSPLAQSFRGVAVTKIDDATIQITLKEAFAPFVETLTTGIIPEHLWRDVPMATAQLAEYNLKPIGAGPFRFVSFEKDKKGTIQSYSLERFEAYHGSIPYLQGMTFRFYPTVNEAIEALKASVVDGIHLIPKQFKEKIPTGNYQSVNLSFPQYTAVFFNQEKNDALKEKRVREALGNAIDRERIVREALKGEAALIASPILPGSVGFIPNTPPPVFDQKKAETLLQDAGWKTITKEEYQKRIEQKKKEQAAAASNTVPSESGKNIQTPELREVERTTTTVKEDKTAAPEKEEGKLLNQYRIKNDDVLTIHLTTINYPENIAVARIIQEGWESISVRVVLDVRQKNFQQQILQPRDYEALLFGIVVGRDPDPYPFWHSSQSQSPGVNLALFANREADTLLEDARRTNDVGIRETKYKRFQEILAEALPADFLYTPSYTYLIGNTLHGFAVKHIAKPDDRFAQITEWYVRTKWT